MRNLLIGFISISAALLFTYEYWQHIGYVQTFLPIPQPVPQQVAKEHVHALIGETLTNKTVECGSALVSDRSVCESSKKASGAPPAQAPHILCVNTIDSPALPGAVNITVQGISSLGEEYTTDIIMFNVGKGPQFLDPIWWSGLNLNVKSNSVEWKYDSLSSACSI